MHRGDVLIVVRHDSGTADIASVREWTHSSFVAQRRSLAVEQSAIKDEASRRQQVFAMQQADLVRQGKEIDTRLSRKKAEIVEQSAVLDKIDKLVGRGLMSILQQQQQRSVVQATEDEVADLEGQKLQNGMALKSSLSEQRTFQFETSQKSVEIDRSLDELNSAMAKGDAQSETDVVAPRDGTVMAVGVGTGELIAAGQALASIGDKNGDLVIRTTVRSKDLAWLRQGQKAALRIDALPYQLHGQVWGTLCEVADAPLVPSRIAADGSVEDARFNISVCVGSGANAMSQIPLRRLVGLHASVILPGRRYQLYEWLMEPVLEARRRFEIR